MIVRLSEINLEKAAVIGLVSCVGSTNAVGWILHLLFWLVVRKLTPRSADWFGGEEANLMLQGEKIDTSPLNSGNLPAKLTFFVTGSLQTGLDTSSMTRELFNSES